MTGWQGYASFERKQRRERCVLCMIVGGIIAIVLLMVIPAFAHIKIPSDLQDHLNNIEQCQYADGTTPGVVACSDPAADKCSSGTFCKEGFCHTHSQENLGGKSAACIEQERPVDPPIEPPIDPPQLEACISGHHRHEDAFENRCHDEDFQHDHVGCTINNQPGHRHGDHACHVDTEGHSHNGGGTVDPPEEEEDEEEEEDDPPLELSDDPPIQCTCCKDVEVTLGEGRTCVQECTSLLRQIPDACPVDPPDNDLPIDPPDEEDPPVDPPELEVCQVAGWHSHADAFEGRCHDEEHQHGYVGCNWNGGPGGHKHDGLACHLATDSHENPPRVVDKPRSEGGSGAGGGGTREVVVPPAGTVVPPVVTPAAKLEARRKAAIENMRNGSWLHALD